VQRPAASGTITGMDLEAQAVGVGAHGRTRLAPLKNG